MRATLWDLPCVNKLTPCPPSPYLMCNAWWQWFRHYIRCQRTISIVVYVHNTCVVNMPNIFTSTYIRWFSFFIYWIYFKLKAGKVMRTVQKLLRMGLGCTIQPHWQHIRESVLYPKAQAKSQILTESFSVLTLETKTFSSLQR